MARPDGLTVRDARPEEYRRLSDLTVAGFEEYRARMPEAAWTPYAADLADVAGRARLGRTLVAVAGGQPVGVVALYPPGPAVPDLFPSGAAYIRALAAHPDWRGRGVGRLLTEACIDATRAAGHESVGLNTHQLMVAARGLYERLGFQVIGTFTLPDYGTFYSYLLPLGPQAGAG
ncbi:MAG TPA: GNAT family N-acetyltransferase [Candidatus Dormibacteraeota bacterium]|jgi:ribosomal protein S18 acetylase RimI-like enzyme|nr:GNAT family N-acetyltransferase [Candidatus Dormibacteraeota bacterium]